MARLFIEQLCAVDFARLDGERGLLGDTWLLDVELEGERVLRVSPFPGYGHIGLVGSRIQNLENPLPTRQSTLDLVVQVY